MNPFPRSGVSAERRPRPARRGRRRLLLGSLVLLALLVLAGWLFPRSLLCVDSGEVRADAIVVLGGGSFERPIRAVELFKQQAAPKIIITGMGDAESNQRLLVRSGVPPPAVQVEPQATTTQENARFTIPLLRAQGARQVIIVTTRYHSRRGLHCFEHYAPDIRFFSRPSYFGYARAEWDREGLTRYIWLEYLKTFWYLVRHGISPI